MTASAAPRPEPLIALTNIRKTYATGAVTFEALRGVDLTIHPGEFAAIIGPSGSGKSTLMNILGCLDTPTSGEYRLAGESVGGFDRDRLADVRNRRIGFVFQSFNLLPQLTSRENVELPLLFKGTGAKERRARVDWLLASVGLSDKGDNRPTELSGGQMQRIAVARALACEPDLILADEPTGNLDTGSGADIVGLFEKLHAEGRTVLLITHDPGVARRADRVIRIQDGRVTEDRGN